MKLPTYKNKDVCIEYCRFSPSIVAMPIYGKTPLKNYSPDQDIQMMIPRGP